MKKISFFCLIYLLFFALSMGATDTIRLNMQADLASFPLDNDGKWIHTYSDYYPSLDFGDYFSFAHMRHYLGGGNPSTEDMAYWDGFIMPIMAIVDLPHSGWNTSGDVWLAEA